MGAPGALWETPEYPVMDHGRAKRDHALSDGTDRKDGGGHSGTADPWEILVQPDLPGMRDRPGSDTGVDQEM